MDSHQKGGLVDHNLHKVIVDRPDRNGPNAGKRCTWSADTDVKDVLGRLQAVRALVVGAVLVIVTEIVAKKTPGGRSGR